MKCNDCKVDYPEVLVRSYADSHTDSILICGICALDRKNKVHETTDKRFHGPQAELLRQRAIAHRISINITTTNPATHKPTGM